MQKKKTKKVTKKTTRKKTAKKKTTKSTKKKVVKKKSKSKATKKTQKKVAKKTKQSKKKTSKKTTAKKKTSKKTLPRKKATDAKKTAPAKLSDSPSPPPPPLKKPLTPELTTKETLQNQENSKAQKNKEDVQKAIIQEVRKFKGTLSLEEFYRDIQSVGFFVSKNDECLEKNCDNPSTTWGHCRLHYISNWQDIKKKQVFLSTGKLQMFVKRLVDQYSPKFIENILSDLSDEKSFFNALKELGISETNEEFDENDDDDIVEDQDISYATKINPRPTNLDEER